MLRRTRARFDLALAIAAAPAWAGLGCTGPAEGTPPPPEPPLVYCTDCTGDCPDRDGDGYADAACGGSDCDDTTIAVGPKQTEIPCNGLDDDCNPNTADDADEDRDGVGVCAGDCDDSRADVAPGNPERICNGLDDDCDPSTEDAPDIDEDNDGFAVCDECDDNAPDIHPDRPEKCGDGIDQNCDGEDGVCPGCGNGIVEPWEQCDDGNIVGGDGCRSDCMGLEVCGDGLADLQAGEDCDGAQDGACPGECSSCTCANPWRFYDVTTAAGINAVHAWDETVFGGTSREAASISGGIAAGDYDGDGWIDLYTVGGNLGQNHLYRNAGNGTFVDTTAMAGVEIVESMGSGPTFADLDGDGGIDLFIGGVVNNPIRVFRNQLDGTFADVSTLTGLTASKNVFGAAFADVDGNGYLDVAIARWGSSDQAPHLLVNQGDGSFLGLPGDGLSPLNNQNGFVLTFSPNFVDVDQNGTLDLLVTSDFGTSRTFSGAGNGTFTETTTSVIDDENGMGAAIGDYDNDGDFDWFVSSIWDPNQLAEANWGVSGNRLYENLGDGTFANVTQASGVRVGYWGWGSCMADFNLDGYLDIFHVNGFALPQAAEFHNDPSVLFINNGDGTFTERASELGIWNVGQGRGVSCFDYDRDGFIDILIAENQGPVSLYKNNGKGTGHFLSVQLLAPPPNTQAIGAIVRVMIGSQTQSRLIRAGTNFASQDPAIAHFGLAAATAVDDVEITWPDGSVQTLGPVAGDQFITVSP